jgi:hypothetical protein
MSGCIHGEICAHCAAERNDTFTQEEAIAILCRNVARFARDGWGADADAEAIRIAEKVLLSQIRWRDQWQDRLAPALERIAAALEGTP